MDFQAVLGKRRLTDKVKRRYLPEIESVKQKALRCWHETLGTHYRAARATGVTEDLKITAQMTGGAIDSITCHCREIFKSRIDLSLTK